MRTSTRGWVKPPPAVRASSFLRPGWLILHMVLLGAAVAMVLLGLWQLRVSESNHFAFQNTSYVVQWWIFSAFALFFWFRLIRDARRPPESAPSTGGEVVLAAGQPGGLAVTGPANLLRMDSTGNVAIAYRGYVLPDSSRTPHRSYGDDYHNAYNDYLWEWALVDGADACAEPSAAPQATTPEQPYPLVDDALEQGRGRGIGPADC